MQGTAADIIKLAMIAVDDWLSASRNGATLIMQVHDELVLRCLSRRWPPRGAGREADERRGGTARVPLKVDVGSGLNWDEAH